MALLSRVADRIYWAARYMERAEDTARLVQSFGELFDDMPSANGGDDGRWVPLLAVFGGHDDPSELAAGTGTAEREVVRRLVADPGRGGSVAATVAATRENLRTTREVLPREAWQAVNDLSIYVADEAARATDRRFRDRVLGRVVDDSRRLEGILLSSMTRDAAYEMWRLGRYVERADMTTRLVGVRAAALMAVDGDGGLDYDEVHWMGVLRSLSALQMYQRATNGPIEATSVVQFLLFHKRFPRSVLFCVDHIADSLTRLSRPESVERAVTRALAELDATRPSTADGADLDDAMDRVQTQIAGINDAITERYLSIDG